MRNSCSNVVSSQMDDFARYGGVIPEVAARSHIEAILPVIEKALTEAACTWNDIDAIGVTYAPGLVGSLLIGALTARTLALMHDKPLYAVHHVEAHVYANFITEIGSGKQTAVSSMENAQTDTRKPQGKASVTQVTGNRSLSQTPSSDSLLTAYRLPLTAPSFPLLALIVSGGHSQLALFRGHGDYVLLGQAQDDAVGEAFDKVAKIIGLPYPGGVSISKLAPEGDAHAFAFPTAVLPCPPGCSHEINTPVDETYQGATVRGGRGELFARDRCHHYDFSFSGLKTAVLRAVQSACSVDHNYPSKDLPQLVSDSLRADVAASFQRVAVETLVDKTLLAYHDHAPASVVIAGGVAANQELRRQLRDALPIPIEYAPMSLCTDNAAMIASLSYFIAQSGQTSDPFTLEVVPSLSMTKTAWRQAADDRKQHTTPAQ